jgi:hypothetical protein
MNKVITFFKADDIASVESRIGSNYDVKRVLGTNNPNVYITDLVPAGVFVGEESIQYAIYTDWDKHDASLLPSVIVEARTKADLNPSSYGRGRVVLEHFNQPLHSKEYLVSKLLGVSDSFEGYCDNPGLHRSYVVELNVQWVNSFKGAICKDYCQIEACLFELFKEGIGYFNAVPDSNNMLFDMLSVGCMARKIHDAKFSIFYNSSSLLNLYLDGVILDAKQVDESTVKIFYADGARVTTKLKFPHLKAFTNYAVARSEDVLGKGYTIVGTTKNYTLVSFYEDDIDLKCAHLPVRVSYSSSSLDVSIDGHSYNISKLVSSFYSTESRDSTLASLIIELLSPFAKFASEISLTELEVLVNLFAMRLFTDSPIYNIFNLLSLIENYKPITRSTLHLLVNAGLLTKIDKHESGTVRLTLKTMSEPVNIPPALVRF